MRVLFVASGNHEMPSPMIENQSGAMMAEGIEIEWYGGKEKV